MRAPATAATVAIALATAAGAQCTTQIVPIPIGTNGPVHELLQLQNGDILLVGDFTSVLGVAANRIARWNGTTVTPLGSGLNGVVRDALELPNGEILVGGMFTTAGGVPAVSIARWNGSSWSSLGTGPGGTVMSIAARPNGEIIVGAVHPDRARRWDGVTWSGLGLYPWPVNFPVFAVHTMPNGDVVISGEALIFVAGGYHDMARWDGTSVQAMPGLGTGSTTGLSGHAVRFKTLRDGTLCAAGNWTSWSVAQWDGTTWGVVPGTQVAISDAYDLSELPNGDWLLGGVFLYLGTNQSARGVVRRRAGVWQPFGSGVTGYAHSFLPLPNGDVLVGGVLSAVDSQPANNLALLVPTCPAAATVAGSGCSGGGGPLALAALSLPFCGATQRSLATGLPANAFGVGILGYTPLAVPLQALLPQALAGCTLLTSPDQLTLLPPNGGTVATSLVVPNVPMLVGAVLQQQVASIELDANGSITAIATTNALQLTVGSS